MVKLFESKVFFIYFTTIIIIFLLFNNTIKYCNILFVNAQNGSIPLLTNNTTPANSTAKTPTTVPTNNTTPANSTAKTPTTVPTNNTTPANSTAKPTNTFTKVSIFTTNATNVKINVSEALDGTLKTKDKNTLNYFVINYPKNGSLLVNQPYKWLFTYSPNKTFKGLDNLTIRASDNATDNQTIYYYMQVNSESYKPLIYENDPITSSFFCIWDFCIRYIFDICYSMENYQTLKIQRPSDKVFGYFENR